MSCQKSEQMTPQEATLESDEKQYSEGKVKREIVVTDESGNNKLFYALYAETDELIDTYLLENKLTAEISTESVEKMKIENLIQNEEAASKNQATSNEKPKVLIDLVATNLEEGVKSYSLNVNEVSGASKTVGNLYAYSTTGPLVGVVHDGNGYELYVQYQYKEHWYSTIWRTYESGGVNMWEIKPRTSYGYYSWFGMNVRKRSMLIRAHVNQNSVNFKVFYAAEDSYGHQCSIGTYDYRNYAECYVGSVPSGTTPFIWGPNYASRNFYHTPASGSNPCPLQGSWLDGANNCWVMDIPGDTYAYTWSRNMLVRSETLLD